MSAREDLVELEREGWRALSGTPDDADTFYGLMLDDDVVLLLPGGVRITDRAAALASMGPGWDGYQLEEVTAVLPRQGIGLVTYGVVARRGAVRYSALVSSVYVRRVEGWRILLHQQTPR